MPTPTKPVNVIKMEKKSHRTKAELELREKGEKALLSAIPLKERLEVKKNKVAHKEFLRINKLLESIEKNDALYEPIINRYCLLQAECLDFEKKKESFYADLQEIIDDKENFEGKDEIGTYYKLKNNMQKQIISLDRQIQTKRKMLLDIEKENIMTIASALRSIPKKVEEQEDEDPMSALLNKRYG